MRLSRRLLTTAALLGLVLLPGLRAQTPADPSGHWEGTIQVPNNEIQFELDLTKNRKGELSGTLGIPAESMKGLPLLQVTMQGASITFLIRRDQPFSGVLSADGTSISGTYAIAGHSIPFSLTRTGEARIEPPTRIAAVGKTLEGAWSATVEVDGKPLRFALTISNHADGTAAGNVVNLDQGETQIPISAITQQGSNVTIDMKTIGGQFKGTLNGQNTELAGTYTQGPLNVPVTFRRGAAADVKK